MFVLAKRKPVSFCKLRRLRKFASLHLDAFSLLLVGLLRERLYSFAIVCFTLHQFWKKSHHEPDPNELGTALQMHTCKFDPGSGMGPR